jgi:hypothetical protein
MWSAFLARLTGPTIGWWHEISSFGGRCCRGPHTRPGDLDWPMGAILGDPYAHRLSPCFAWQALRSSGRSSRCRLRASRRGSPRETRGHRDRRDMRALRRNPRQRRAILRSSLSSREHPGSPGTDFRGYLAPGRVCVGRCWRRCKKIGRRTPRVYGIPRLRETCARHR